MRKTVTVTMLAWLLCGLAASAEAQQPIGDFYLFPRTEDGSGEDRSSITTLADESYVSGAGGLTFQCTEEGLTLIVSASYIGLTLSTQVRYAFGDEEPTVDVWSVRTTGMAVIAPPEVLDAFVERAVGEDSVVFRVSDFQMRRHTYTFRLGGLEEALGRLGCR